MVAWRVAKSLETLRLRINELAPNRSKASDGGIGDAAHATRDSDHNPWFVLNGQPLVTARDFTHDPAGGLDCNKLAAGLLAAKDPRVKYMIWNRRICDFRPAFEPYTWQPYTGVNPHTKHLHLSVKDDPTCDDPRPWSLPGLDREDDMDVPRLSEGDGVSGSERGTFHWYVMSLQALLNVRGLSRQLVVDGKFGPETTAMVKELQARWKLEPTGVVDAETWRWALGNLAPDYAA